MKPEDYLIKENYGKQYALEKKDGQVVWGYVAKDIPEDPLEFFSAYGWDAETIQLWDIDSVVQELPDDYNEDCNGCFNGKISVLKALSGEEYCDDCKIRECYLTPFKTPLNNVYKYDNLDQLQKLYDTLDHPISDNFETDWSTNKINMKMLKGYGLMYVWSNMGDFDDSPSEYCAIIDGAKL